MKKNICRYGPKHRLPLTTIFYASEKDRNHVTSYETRKEPELFFRAAYAAKSEMFILDPKPDLG
jgi:hypothetical protein